MGCRDTGRPSTFSSYSFSLPVPWCQSEQKGGGGEKEEEEEQQKEELELARVKLGEAVLWWSWHRR